MGLLLPHRGWPALDQPPACTPLQEPPEIWVGPIHRQTSRYIDANWWCNKQNVKKKSLKKRKVLFCKCYSLYYKCYSLPLAPGGREGTVPLYRGYCKARRCRCRESPLSPQTLECSHLPFGSSQGTATKRKVPSHPAYTTRANHFLRLKQFSLMLATPRFWCPNLIPRDFVLFRSHFCGQ